MPILKLWIGDHDLLTLEQASASTGRQVDELAESALAEAASDWRRQERLPITEADTLGRV